MIQKVVQRQPGQAELTSNSYTIASDHLYKCTSTSILSPSSPIPIARSTEITLSTRLSCVGARSRRFDIPTHNTNLSKAHHQSNIRPYLFDHKDKIKVDEEFTNGKANFSVRHTLIDGPNRSMWENAFFTLILNMQYEDIEGLLVMFSKIFIYMYSCTGHTKVL